MSLQYLTIIFNVKYSMPTIILGTCLRGFMSPITWMEPSRAPFVPILRIDTGDRLYITSNAKNSPISSKIVVLIMSQNLGVFVPPPLPNH